jgi:hypothetical protein
VRRPQASTTALKPGKVLYAHLYSFNDKMRVHDVVFMDKSAAEHHTPALLKALTVMQRATARPRCFRALHGANVIQSMPDFDFSYPIIGKFILDQ